MRVLQVLLCVACAACASASGIVEVTERGQASGPRVLGVIAHPDDETAFAATLYKITAQLDGICDLVVITNGEGGFKYATLAERIYGVELTDETVGRAALPAIRRREMIAAAGVLGLRRIEFLGQKDHRYSTDLAEVLGPEARVWDLTAVRAALARVLASERYGFVIGLAPTLETHAHHQAATALLAEAVRTLPEAVRPVMLVARVRGADEAPGGPFQLDRTQKFGFQEKLDYRIVVNWDIAAHKSQGTMQLAMNQGEREEFTLFGDPSGEAARRTAELFERLRQPQFEPRTYGASAGTNAGVR